MKTLRIAAVIVSLSIPACYDFDFPLDPKPQVPVDARVVGTWRCLSAEASADEGAATLRVERRSEMISHWTFETPSSDGTPDQGEFDVHGSAIGGGALLNARDVGDGDLGKWSFVRYTLLIPDVLRIQIVDDQPFLKVKDSASDLRQAVEQRVGDPAIYKDFCVCVRVKPSPEPSPSPSR